MQPDQTRQDVWMTFRFKGSMPAGLDPVPEAHMILAKLESFIMRGSDEPHHRLCRGLFWRKPPEQGFVLTQPSDLIEVEEECEIYEQDPPIL